MAKPQEKGNHCLPGDPDEGSLTMAVDSGGRAVIVSKMPLISR